MAYAGDKVLASDVSALAGVPWASFTPTWTNLTVGSGVGTYSYIRVGRLIVASYDFVLGGTSAVGTGPYVTLPVAAAANQLLGCVSEYRDTSAPAVYAGVVLLSGTVLLPCRLVEARTSLSATAPFTWASGDSLRWIVTYQAAS